MRPSIPILTVAALCVLLVGAPQPVAAHQYPHECTNSAELETELLQSVFASADDTHAVAIPVEQGDTVRVLQGVQEGHAVTAWHRQLSLPGDGPVVPGPGDPVPLQNGSNVGESNLTVRGGSPATYAVTIDEPGTTHLCVGNYVGSDRSIEPFQWRIRYAVNERPDWWTDARTGNDSLNFSTVTPHHTSGATGPGFGPLVALAALAVVGCIAATLRRR
jgi:PGF-CTERM protein